MMCFSVGCKISHLSYGDEIIPIMVCNLIIGYNILKGDTVNIEVYFCEHVPSYCPHNE